MIPYATALRTLEDERTQDQRAIREQLIAGTIDKPYAAKAQQGIAARFARDKARLDRQYGKDQAS